jgi:hypothetical protein
MFDLYKRLEKNNISVIFKNNQYYYNNYTFGVPPVVANYFGLSEDMVLYITYLHKNGADFDDIGCDLIERFNMFNTYGSSGSSSYAWTDD